MRWVVLALMTVSGSAWAQGQPQLFAPEQVTPLMTPGQLQWQQNELDRQRLENERLRQQLEWRREETARQRSQPQPTPYCRYPNGQVALCPRPY